MSFDEAALDEAFRGAVEVEDRSGGLSARDQPSITQLDDVVCEASALL
ncbi:MAG: hypothetical protein ACLGI5_04550 [Thermoleophilia bacterium]